ncbi:MAG: hypothetical protein CO098_04580, partial [Bacteroidetes bacterium CG_4_9_14_3_um_filter_41_19]
KSDKIREGFLFKEGSVLNEEYINSLTSDNEKEAAHQMNRRSEFRVLRKDYVPAGTNLDIVDINIVTNPDDNSVLFTEQGGTGTYLSTCIINGYNESFAFDKGADPMISLNKAMDLLKWGAISKENFEGDPEKVLANNTIADRAVINIKEITIGNVTVNDVQLKVTYKLNYGLVFGDGLMKQFGKYNFNTKTHKLTID